MKKKNKNNKNNVDDVTFGTGYRLFALILYMPPDMMYVPRDEKFVLFLFFVFVYLVGYPPPQSKYGCCWQTIQVPVPHLLSSTLKT